MKELPALLRLGFRPFFIAAPLFAALAMLGWLLALSGVWVPGTPTFAPTMWHAHEMVFGYAMAVVAGFLLTAARNWTSRETPTGSRLLFMVGAWALGRMAMTGVLPGPAWAIGACAMLFPLLLWAAIAAMIIPARSKRNYGILVLLALLVGFQLTSHVAGATHSFVLQRTAVFAAVHLLVLLHVVISGRVIPMFTRNGLMARGLGPLPAPRGDGQPRLWLTRVGLGASVATALLATLNAYGIQSVKWLLVTTAATAAVAHLLRMGAWLPWKALRVPMLAVLHIGHLWIVVGYALLAWFAATGYATAPAPTHALTVGVFGTMTVGMMARVSFGHTGRPIEANPLVLAAFFAMGAAAVTRVGSVLLLPSSALLTRNLPGVLFAVSMLALLAAMLPILTAPRPDGRPG
jgi:uncharacterized protein involved in response to NO